MNEVIFCPLKEIYLCIKEKGIENQSPYLEIGNVNIRDKTYRLSDKKSVKGCKTAYRTDVLISRVRPTRGAVAIIKEDRLLVSSAFTIIHNKWMADKYLFYYLSNNEIFFNYLGRLSTGTMYPTVAEEVIVNSSIPVVPYNEQKRIVAKLDQIIPRIDAVKARLNMVPDIIKRFRQSVLIAACSGKLTESIEDYPIEPFCDLIKSIRGGTTGVPTNEFTNFPVLRSSSVRQGHIDLQDVKYLKREQSINKNNFISNGDLLFTRLNGTAEYVGNCALVSGIQLNKYQYPDRLYCAKLTDKISPAYCVIAFSLPEIRIEIENRAKSSAGHKRISISDIKEMNIPLPPFEEQKEIVCQVEKLFALADRLESHYMKAKARIDKLSQSVLAKAFHGELVITEAELAEKDHHDFESAEKLLERIKKEKIKLEILMKQKQKKINLKRSK